MKSIQRKGFWIAGLLAILILLTMFSSTLPDGLEWVAHRLGFQQRETGPPLTVFSDYTISRHLPPGLNQVLSALLGALLLAGILFLVSKWTASCSKKGNGSHEA